MTQQMCRLMNMSLLRSSFAKRRPLEESVALTEEYYQRLGKKLAADPENYGFGMTLLYTLITKT